MVRETTSLPKKSKVDDRDRFTLVSSYQPAGDQGTAIAALVEGLGDGLARQVLLGVTGSGKTFTVASVILASILVLAVVIGELAAGEDGSLLPPYFDQRDFPTSQPAP